MEDYKKKIDDIIEKAVTDKVFSLEIIDSIKKLKDDFKKVVTENELLIENNKQLNKNLSDTASFRDKYSTELTEYKLREEEISKKEKELDRNKYMLEFQTTRANEIKEIFGIVFRNPVVRETAIKSSYSSQNGYSTNSNNENITTETKEE